MTKLYKGLLSLLFVSSITLTVSAQETYWSSRSDKTGITTDKAVARLAYPKEFKLFTLDIAPLSQKLFSIVGRNAAGSTAVITLPAADGSMEQFQVWEASNFEPALQERFPEIRAYSGRSLTNPGSTLKLSIAPNGIQTMVFRANGQPNEYIEPYSADHTVYSVFQSQRNKGASPWLCSTPDVALANDLTNQLHTQRPESNAGQLKTMRLAQSCNGEYSNYFGAFNSGQVALVLAAFNATLTRCNGCYEKDLAIHLNLVPQTTNVIYYDPATDPYSTLGNWNTELQIALNTTLTGPSTPLAANNAAYDIGHMFGASGGGGNAGCIGCVCVDGIASGTGSTKGRGITSPADGIPQGDNFDIDYVAHEVGHQMGGNHTFSMSLEGTGQNKEVGSGITIMGYAGITAQDVAPHSIDIFHETSIQQIQVNMAGKTCPITTNLTGINATPTVTGTANTTIPISTPFALTAVGNDADAGDVLTYCWEQNDNSTTSGAASVASPTKLTGPNWLSFSPTTNPTRTLPILATILAGNSITGPLPGGDAGANIEALSSVGRTLNFRVTVRDNRPYNSGTGAVGQTNFYDNIITVDATVGPFLITSQNAAVSYSSGSTQTVTWSVNGTTGAPTNTANVKISWSTDNGATFTTLIASTPNDGTETFTVPGTLTTQGRIKVEAIGNIYFDINNAPITVTLPVNGYTFGTPTTGSAGCPAAGPINSTLPVTFQGTYTGPVTLTYLSGAPAGTTVSISPSSFTANGNATVSLSGTGALVPGTYTVVIQGSGPAPGVTQTANVSFTVNAGSGPVITGQPVSIGVCAGTNASFAVTATGVTGYQWQQSTTGCAGTFSNIAGANASTYTVTAPTVAQNGYAYRCILTGQCGVSTSNCVTLTVNAAPAITGNPASVAVCSGSAASFTVAATGAGLTYQWQLSTNGGGTWTDIAGATNSTYTIAATTLSQNANQFRCIVSGTCTPTATSTAAVLTVNSSVTVTASPSNATICEGTGTSFSAAASGTGLSYQWEVSTNGGVTWTSVVNGANYSGANTPTLTLINTPPTFNQNRYRCNITSPPCTPGITASALLTVNSFPVITGQPASQTFCEGSNASLSVAATTSVGTLTYQWQASTNGGASWFNLVLPGSTVTPTNTNTLSQTTISAAQNGYQYRCAVTAGCGTTFSNAATFTVNTYPVFSLNSLPKVVCVSDPAQTLTATISGGTWSGTGITAAGVFTPSVAGVGAKPLTYTATNAGCTKAVTSQILVDECPTRHRKLNEKLAVIIYPVPNNGNFSLRMNSDLYTNLGVQVFTAGGQRILNATYNGLSFGSVIPMSLTSLPNGTYFIYMTNSENGFISRGDGIIIMK